MIMIVIYLMKRSDASINQWKQPKTTIFSRKPQPISRNYNITLLCRINPNVPGYTIYRSNFYRRAVYRMFLGSFTYFVDLEVDRGSRIPRFCSRK